MNTRKGFDGIWEEKYRPQTLDDVVLPDDLRKQLQGYVEDNAIPNLLFVSNIPGCSIKGNNIEIRKKLYSKSEAIEKYEILKRDYIFDSVTNQVLDKYEINDIVVLKLIDAWDEYKHKIRGIFQFESKVSNKYCSFVYWLNFNDIEFSIIKVRQVRHRIKYFESSLEDLKFKNNKSGKLALLKLRKSIIDYPINKDIKDLDFFKPQSSWSSEFWSLRGYDDDEISDIIFTRQKDNNTKKCKLIKENPEKYLKTFNTNIEYYLSKGFSQEQVEKKYPNSKMRCDFYLPEFDEYIEIAGMMSDQQYREKMKRKHKNFGAVILEPEQMINYIKELKCK
jgi:hypothetical protein